MVLAPKTYQVSRPLNTPLDFKGSEQEYLADSILQFLVSVFASFGSILYGYDLGVVAEVIACDAFKTYFNSPTDVQT